MCARVTDEASSRNRRRIAQKIHRPAAPGLLGCPDDDGDEINVDDGDEVNVDGDDDGDGSQCTYQISDPLASCARLVEMSCYRSLPPPPGRRQ